MTEHEVEIAGLSVDERFGPKRVGLHNQLIKGRETWNPPSGGLKIAAQVGYYFAIEVH